jgi:hypothetical protein
MKIVLMKTKFYLILLSCTVLFSVTRVKAQTVCNGESVRFRETFGTSSLAEAFPDGRTSYKFMGSSELEIGEYIVAANTQVRSEWHSTADHTGDANGQMMIINPGYADGDFYSDSIDNLTTAGFYSVSLYVLNVTKPGTCLSGAVLPKLQIEIEYLNGATAYQHLSTYTSDFIQSSVNPTWVKVISGFVLPPGIHNIRYRIINNSLGECGNSLAIDDITFSQCASLTTLPVKGLKINNIEPNGSGVKLLFSTESESQTSRMEAQRSYDGINWTTFNTQAAAGTSDQYRAYTATDFSPMTQVTYYRIRQTDLKGEENYSAIVKYKASSSTSFLTAYPTPFTSQLNLNFNSPENDEYTATLYSANGLSLQRQTINARKGTNLIQFNTNNLKQGTYMITVVNADGTVRLSQKTVKQ